MTDESKKPEAYFSDALIPAKYVQLAGSMAVGGMQTRNFDAVRDVCTMHLHAETGGVFVQRGEDHFYIAPIAVQSVDLIGAVRRPEDANLPTPFMSPLLIDPPYPVLTAQEAEAETKRVAVAKGARNLADEVLAEFTQDAPKSATTRRKKN